MSGGILVNADILSPSYMPDKLLHREKELSQLKRNLQNFISTFITGECGSGKTTLAKKALLCLGNSKKVCASYVDCAIYQTTYSILKEIVPRSEFIFYRSNYELVKELMKQAKERKFVVCLDNFESMKDYGLIAKFLSMGVCVLLISDEEESFSLLTENVRSNIPSILRLPSYSNEQTFEILKARAELALGKWAYTDALTKRIADSVKGNIALAINALKVAALTAEGRGKRAIEEADIPEIEDCPMKLSVDEKVLLKILEEWKSLPARRLYDFYLQSVRYPKSERSFRNYMESLCSKGLVEAIGEKRGRVYEIVEVEGNAVSKG